MTNGRQGMGIMTTAMTNGRPGTRIMTNGMTNGDAAGGLQGVAGVESGELLELGPHDALLPPQRYPGGRGYPPQLPGGPPAREGGGWRPPSLPGQLKKML
jgi:hypothetical protein